MCVISFFLFTKFIFIFFNIYDIILNNYLIFGCFRLKKERCVKMDNSLFYINFDSLDEKGNLINEIKKYSMEYSNPVYIINKPLHIINKTSEEIKKDYSYEKAMVVLTPKHKIIFINFGNNNDTFEDYVENFIDDIGYISRRYGFETIIDKSRSWRKNFIRFIRACLKTQNQ